MKKYIQLYIMYTYSSRDVGKKSINTKWGKNGIYSPRIIYRFIFMKIDLFFMDVIISSGRVWLCIRLELRVYIIYNRAPIHIYIYVCTMYNIIYT